VLIIGLFCIQNEQNLLKIGCGRPCHNNLLFGTWYANEIIPGPSRVLFYGPGSESPDQGLITATVIRVLKAIIMDTLRFMSAAYQEALKALDESEVPVGAVIVRNGTIIGRGYNRVEHLQDPTAHAEIIAISAASSGSNSWRLNDCTIYVTLEPCLMCLGALVLARIERIVYGASDPRAGAVDTFLHRQEIERAYHYFPQVTSGILSEDCSSLLSSFFKRLRKKS
jgi:tRNA(adenine34) deaminase